MANCCWLVGWGLNVVEVRNNFLTVRFEPESSGTDGSYAAAVAVDCTCTYRMSRYAEDGSKMKLNAGRSFLKNMLTYTSDRKFFSVI